MKYSKKLISLPEDMYIKLGKEKNASATVNEALIAHYGYKDNLRRLASKVDVLVSHLERLQAPKQQEDEEQFVYKSLVPGRPAVKVDTHNDTFYDSYRKQWIPTREIEI